MFQENYSFKFPKIKENYGISWVNFNEFNNSIFRYKFV